MSHDFHCDSCGSWVANCGFSDDNHSQTFSFSTTCGCGQKVSGSCGGAKEVNTGLQAAQAAPAIELHNVKCNKCGAVMGVVLSKGGGGDVGVQSVCRSCGSTDIVLEKQDPSNLS